MLSSLFRSLGTGVTVMLLIFPVGASADESPQIQMGSKSSEVIMTKIIVSDLRRSLDFYTQVVGLKQADIPGLPKPVIDDPDAEIIQVMLNFSGSAADAILCLVKQKGVVLIQDATQLTSVVFKTTDARAAMSRAKAAGAAVQSEAKAFWGVVEGSVRDPDGYRVTFLEAQSVGAEAAK